MHTLQLQIRKIRGGFIVTYTTDEPLTHQWKHDEEFAPTLDEAIDKVAAAVNSLVNIKRLAEKGQL